MMNKLADKKSSDEVLNKVCRKSREVAQKGNLVSIMDEDPSDEFLKSLTNASVEKMVSGIASGKLKMVSSVMDDPDMKKIFNDE